MKKEKSSTEFYKEYCTGCGLCNAVLKCDMEKDEKGFYISKGNSDDFSSFCSTVCPAGGAQCKGMSLENEWGDYEEVYLANAKDDSVRYNGSTGGVLTAIALCLLNEKLVDGIIQVRVSKKSPIETETICSTTEEEILSCTGSRYTSSSPLYNIDKFLKKGKWAFIGKPCDVTALRNYSKMDSCVEEHIVYMLSFFCAGTPSERSNQLLLNKMGTNIEDCVSLKYRGEGWPGSTKAVNNNGDEYIVDYQTSWRETLGRDIRLICRYCLDGIGELADISCGDAWYIDDKGEPIFPDVDGRNVIFVRNKAGKTIIKIAEKKGYIEKKVYEKCYSELAQAQKFQFQRKYHLWATFLGLRSMGREHPHYSNEILKAFHKKTTPKARIKRYLGTLKRIILNKI